MKEYAIPIIAAIGTVSALLAVRRMAFGFLRGWAAKTETEFDDMVVDSIKTPSIYWCFAIGLYIGIAVSDLPVKYIEYLGTAIKIIIVVSVTIAASNLSGRAFQSYVTKASLPMAATGLAYGVVKGVILTSGFLIILSVMGISITPLITALGVGGLAVALALQDTLSNLFSGLHILMEKSVRVGDFIKLETGEEGYVEDITWRTTRIRMLPNNMVIIPNGKLAQSIVTNYCLPDKSMSVLIPISVAYGSDPAKVEGILVEEAKAAIGNVPGLLAEPEPFVRFIPGFGESSLDFTLICRVGEFVDQYLVQHELRKRILKRFEAEGIDIPFPQRDVHLKGIDSAAPGRIDGLGG